jgi:hypothetical protein
LINTPVHSENQTKISNVLSGRRIEFCNFKPAGIHIFHSPIRDYPSSAATNMDIVEKKNVSWNEKEVWKLI